MSDVPIRVLLVRGHSDEIRLLPKALSASDVPPFRLTQAGCLHEALQILEEERFDAILLDPALADAQGLDVLVQVRERAGQAPIILFLGPADQELILEGALRRRRDELEEEVEARTAEVSWANRQLPDEIARRRQIEEALRQERDMVARAETLLRAERDILDTIMENTHAQLAYLDREFNFVRVNSAYVRGCGHSREELIGRNHFELFPDAENRGIFEQVRDAGRAVRFYAKPFEYADQPERGTTYWDWTLAPAVDQAGQTQGLVLSLLNVTERVRAEEGLLRAQAELERRVEERTSELSRANVLLTQEIEERKQVEWALRQERDFVNGLIDTVRAIILVLDPQGRIVRFNPYMEALSGYALEQVQGKDWFSTFLPERDRARIGQVFESALYEAPTRDNVNPILTADGREIQIEWRDSTLRDRDGEVSGLLAVGQDITERLRAAAEARYQATLVENVSDAIISTDLDFHILSWNRAAERMYGWSGREAIGRPVSEVLQTRYPHHQPAQVDVEFQAHGQWEGEVIQQRRDGTPIYVLTALSAIVDSAGERIGTVSINRDISERVRAEATLRRRVEELNALNAFSAQVSGTLSLEEVAEAALTGVAGHVAPDLSMLYLRRGDELLLQRAHAVDPELQAVDAQVKRVGQCLCGLAAQERKAVYSSDLLADPRCAADACRTAGIRSFVALPLLRGAEVLGVLGLASIQRRDWQHGAPFLEGLASHVATALQNALLHEELRRRAAGML